jgi:catechol 2,3-dioxygenase-like lactoylglutathione lyase family enzyme
MRLNHLDLQVSDVPAAIVFFEQLFELQCQSNRASPAIAILSDDAGFVLVLQRKKDPASAYPEGFHLGFLVEDVALVHQVHARAKAAGVQVSDVIHNNRGVLIYCASADGYSVEVSCRRELVASDP